MRFRNIMATTRDKDHMKFCNTDMPLPNFCRYLRRYFLKSQFKFFTCTLFAITPYNIGKFKNCDPHTLEKKHNCRVVYFFMN